MVIYTVFTENRVWTIKVQCIDIEENKTEAEIKYIFTSLNEKGIEINRESLETMYEKKTKRLGNCNKLFPGNRKNPESLIYFQ